MADSRPVLKVGVAFVVGLIAAPYLKPALEKVVRASVGAGFQLRELAEKAASDFQDIAAEEKAKTSVDGSRTTSG